MKQNSLSIVLIVGLVGLVIVLWDTDPNLLIPKETGRKKDVLFPYAMLKDARTQYFDETGGLSYEFFAKELHYYREDLDISLPSDFTSMSRPELTLYTQGAPWKVTADSGKILDLGEKLTLMGDVTVWQTQDNGDTTKLTTESLVIFPETKLVNTDADVTINSSVGKVTATGLEVNLETRNIKLLSKVKGHYEPI